MQTGRRSDDEILNGVRVTDVVLLVGADGVRRWRSGRAFAGCDASGSARVATLKTTSYGRGGGDEILRGHGARRRDQDPRRG